VNPWSLLETHLLSRSPAQWVSARQGWLLQP
jgi:hypothetical protein